MPNSTVTPRPETTPPSGVVVRTGRRPMRMWFRVVLQISRAVVSQLFLEGTGTRQAALGPLLAEGHPISPAGLARPFLEEYSMRLVSEIRLPQDPVQRQIITDLLSSPRTARPTQRHQVDLSRWFCVEMAAYTSPIIRKMQRDTIRLNSSIHLHAHI